MVEPVRHRRTKGAETDMFEPKATASHLDSTHRVISLRCGIWSLWEHSGHRVGRAAISIYENASY